MSNCSTCHRPLDVPGDESSRDCGGDCLRCMAEAGDPDCARVMRGIAQEGIWRCAYEDCQAEQPAAPGDETTSPERGHTVQILIASSLDYRAASKAPVLGAQSNWHHSYDLELLNEDIRLSFSELPAKTALQRIGSIWSLLDKSVSLAEARTRLLLKRVPAPELAEAPNWLEKQLPSLSRKGRGDDVAAAHLAAINSASNLVRACLHVADRSGIEARLDKGPLGRVAVEWLLGAERNLSWMVEACDLPWPGVKVVIYLRRGEGSSAHRSIKIMHTAHDVVAEFREALNG